MAGVPSPTDNPVVEAVRSASKRILETATVNCKEPISSDFIHSNLDNPVDLRNVTMFVSVLLDFLDLMIFLELEEAIFSSMKVSR